MKGGNRLKEEAKKTPDDEEDYVWRFKLEPSGDASSGEDPMIEMVRTFLADFLSIGFLTQGEKRVEVDGFSFEKNPEVIHEIFTRAGNGSIGRK